MEGLPQLGAAEQRAACSKREFLHLWMAGKLEAYCLPPVEKVELNCLQSEQWTRGSAS